MLPKTTRNPHIITLSFTSEEFAQIEKALMDQAHIALSNHMMPMRRATFLRSVIIEGLKSEEIITKIITDQSLREV